MPLLAAVYAIMYFTDPSLAPQPPRKLMEEMQGKGGKGSNTCTKIHASDLNKYIKANPDEVSDEHTIGWNKMYDSFKNYRKNQTELERKEEDYARQLSQYARMEENKGRSTKVKGTMATEGGNRNITHRQEMIEEGQGQDVPDQTFGERMSARMAEAKRRFTSATKGRIL